MTSIRFFHTPDGGEISAMPEGAEPFAAQLESLAYLCLFGSNQDDPGGSDRKLQWWGNLSERDSIKRLRSETQHLLRGLPRTTANLRRLEDAVQRDLGPALAAVQGKILSVQITLQQRNRVQIAVHVEVRARVTNLEFTESWQQV